MAHGDNPYVLDIWAKIATLQGDEKSAREALSKLQLVDKSFYFHRKSTVELAFDNPSEAEAASEDAIEAEASPPFHLFAQLCNCKIVIGKIDEAERIMGDLDKQYSRTHIDVRLGLRARLAIAKGHYSEALRLSDKMHDRRSIPYMNIRAEAIKGELQTSALRDDIRESLNKELAILEQELSGAHPFDLSALD